VKKNKKIDFVTVTMKMISKTTLMNVADEKRSREASFDKDKGTIFEIIHVCFHCFGCRKVTAGDEALSALPASWNTLTIR
jgi:hypothetical protein